MISVRRIAIAVGTVVAAFGLLVLAIAAHEHCVRYGIDWYNDKPLIPFVAILAMIAIVPRWRRHLGAASAVAAAALLLIVVHFLETFPFHPAPKLFDSFATIFLLAALAALTRGRLPMVAPLAVVTATVLALAVPILVFLICVPFDAQWVPPTWDDPQHLHPLSASELCRGVTLFNVMPRYATYFSIDRLTSNFRGEHRPMVLLRGHFRDEIEWVPPEALAHTLVDDRDPALHPCERAGRHPMSPRADEPVHDQLTF